MTLLQRVPSFVAVGCTAAAVHFSVVLLLVGCAAVAPLAANVAGWSIAFVASFLGQWRFTFRVHAAPAWQALWRYFVLSLGGFAANEAVYAALLRWTRLPYDLLLAAVLLGVACFTYVLSSRWAFGGAWTAGAVDATTSGTRFAARRRKELP
jgi:putative flippase GtrA